MKTLQRLLAISLGSAIILTQPQSPLWAAQKGFSGSGGVIVSGPAMGRSLPAAVPAGFLSNQPSLSAPHAVNSINGAVTASAAASISDSAQPAPGLPVAELGKHPLAAAAASTPGHDAAAAREIHLSRGSRLAPDAGDQAAPGDSRLFDGTAVRPDLPDGLRVYLTRPGHAPVSGALSDVPRLLAAEPEYAANLNAKGRVRVVLAARAGALRSEHLGALGAVLTSAGLAAAIHVEKLSVEAKRGPAEVTASPKPSGLVLRVVTWPARELAFLGHTFAAAFTRPTKGEIIGGLVSKGPAFALSVGWWMKIMLPAHPLAFAAAVGLSFAQEVFHGLFINTWQNVQNVINRQRGSTYQSFFNLAYMQVSSAAYRMITWSVIRATIVPWQAQYWRDMGITTLAGTFFGTLGYSGLNTLYEKGVISRGARSWIQQGRDFFFLVAGTFFASSSMSIFWPIFIAQQSIDLLLFIAGFLAPARPTAYVADNDVARSESFQAMYPVKDQGRVSPLRMALSAMLGIPLVSPIVMLVKGVSRAASWLWRRVFGARR